MFPSSASNYSQKDTIAKRQGYTIISIDRSIMHFCTGMPWSILMLKENGGFPKCFPLVQASNFPAATTAMAAGALHTSRGAPRKFDVFTAKSAVPFFSYGRPFCIWDQNLCFDAFRLCVHIKSNTCIRMYITTRTHSAVGWMLITRNWNGRPAVHAVHRHCNCVLEVYTRAGCTCNDHLRTIALVLILQHTYLRMVVHDGYQLITIISVPFEVGRPPTPLVLCLFTGTCTCRARGPCYVNHAWCTCTCTWKVHTCI